MKMAKASAILLVSILLVTGVACGTGAGQAPAPTPIPTYTPTAYQGQQSMQMYEEAPIYMIITDPDGLVIGGDINEIPDAIYSQHDSDGDGRLDNIAWFSERKEGEYLITIIPKDWALPSDSFCLSVEMMEQGFGYTEVYIAKDVLISEIPDEPYIWEMKPREATNISYTGELSCRYRDTLSLSAVLTDGSGNPLSGKTVTFQLGSQTAIAVTDSDGRASTSTTVYQEPSPYHYMDTGFPSDMDYLPSYDNNMFEVLPSTVDISQLIGGTWINYSTDTELEGNPASTIASDGAGNLWFGTMNGAIKFDGSSWTTYTTDDGLASNGVWVMASDDDGTMWFGTAAGVSKFDGSTWTTYTAGDGLASDVVTSIACDGEGNTWVGYSRSYWIGMSSGDYSGLGVSKFDGSTWTTYTAADGLANDLVQAIACDNESNVWFGTPRGLGRFDGSKWYMYTRDDGLAGNKIYDITVAPDGALWFVTDRGVSKLDGATWSTYLPPQIECELLLEGKLGGTVDGDIAVDDDGCPWVIMWRWSEYWGVGLLSMFDGDVWTIYTRMDGLNCYFGTFGVAIDADGNAWVATDKGVFKFEEND